MRDVSKCRSVHCVSVCISFTKKWFTQRGRDLLYLWVFILIVFAFSLPQDGIVIAWLLRTKLYIFCYMNHYKQQLWEGTLGPVIILMKQKDCIPSEVNFSRSQIQMLSAHSKHAGKGAKTIGGSDCPCLGRAVSRVTTEGRLDLLVIPSCLNFEVDILSWLCNKP